MVMLRKAEDIMKYSVIFIIFSLCISCASVDKKDIDDLNKRIDKITIDQHKHGRSHEHH